MRIVAYTKYDRQAASTRQRILQYRPHLRASGIELDYRPLLTDEYVRSLATGEPFSRPAIAANYARRVRELFAPGEQVDLLWIYAELFPYLPAAIERLAFRSGAPVVYDWDDAIFIPYREHRNPLVRRMMARKFERVLPHAAAVTCGNAYLRDYCARFCDRSVIFPTIVDADIYRPVARASGARLTLGWIGSPSTWANVRPLLPVIERFCAEHRARFRVVGAGAKARSDRFAALDLVDWIEEQEIEEVQAFDIGIMPLIDAPFQRGKSGYKLIQYMACGLPTVASPVGVNCDIVEDGRTGFLATTPEQWRDSLSRLAADPGLRERMGAYGRTKVVESYSLQSQAPRLVQLFKGL